MKSTLLKTGFCICIGLSTISSVALAQFRDALVPGVSYGISPVLPLNTGNDVLENGGNTYAATVWDDGNGNNAGFGWKVGNIVGFTPIGLGLQVMDPDIALVKSNGGTVYAVVVYYDNTQQRFMMESYQWNTGQNQFTALLPVVLAAGQYNRSINIGANDNGEFAIVWDEPGDLIRMSIGRAQTSIPVIVPIGGSTFIDLLPGSQPDVVVYRNSVSGIRQVNVAYRHPGAYLEVDFYRWNDLNSGIINPIPYFRSSLPDLAYQNPRIACPGSTGSNSNDFTLVAEDTDGNSTWFIKVFNSNMCCTPNFSSYIYNDGSTGNSPYNTTDVPNTKPVVSYDNAYNMVWVGWEIDNSFGLLSAPGAAFGRFPIAITGNKRGRLEAFTKYLYVPSSVSFGVNSGTLSIAGSRSSNALFSYVDVNTNQVYYKSYQHILNTQQLRTSGSGLVDFEQWLGTLSSEENVELEIYDLSGRKVMDGSMEPQESIQEMISAKLQNHASSIMVIKAQAKSQSMPYNGLLFFPNSK